MSDQNEEIEYLRQCLRQRERELEAVRRITAALHQKTSLDDLVRETLFAAVDTVEAAAGSISLHDPAHDELVFRSRWVIGCGAEVLEGARVPTSQGIAGHVFRTGQTEITPDVASDQRHFKEIDRTTRVATRNMVTVPLKTTTGLTLGVMQILNKKEGGFTPPDGAVLEILGAQAATAIETARLYDRARVADVAEAIGDISHDIKNMIIPSVTGIDTLRPFMEEAFSAVDALRAAPTQNDLWNDVDRAVGSLRSLYPEIFDMIQGGAEAVQERATEVAEAVRDGIAPVEFKPTGAVDEIEKVLQVLRMAAQRVRVELTFNPPANLPAADLDAKRFRNAIQNLIWNALNETPAGGHVAIRLAALLDRSRPGGGMLEVVVADTGRGMSPEVRERLFTDRPITTRLQGTGLGTRIVKNAVEAHHGTIAVESAEGQGTTFNLHFPLHQPTASAPPP